MNALAAIALNTFREAIRDRDPLPDSRVRARPDRGLPFRVAAHRRQRGQDREGSRPVRDLRLRPPHGGLRRRLARVQGDRAPDGLHAPGPAGATVAVRVRKVRRALARLWRFVRRAHGCGASRSRWRSRGIARRAAVRRSSWASSSSSWSRRSRCCFRRFTNPILGGGRDGGDLRGRPPVVELRAPREADDRRGRQGACAAGCTPFSRTSTG